MEGGVQRTRHLGEVSLNFPPGFISGFLSVSVLRRTSERLPDSTSGICFGNGIWHRIRQEEPSSDSEGHNIFQAFIASVVFLLTCHGAGTGTGMQSWDKENRRQLLSALSKTMGSTAWSLCCFFFRLFFSVDYSFPSPLSPPYRCDFCGLFSLAAGLMAAQGLARKGG